MQHLKSKITFGREAGPRRAMLRNLAESLVLHGSIATTESKAKYLRTVIEPLITKARTKTLAARRQVIRVLYTEKAVKKLMDEIAPRYEARKGGYTRVIKLNARTNDGAKMARIEFV